MPRDKPKQYIRFSRYRNRRITNPGLLWARAIYQSTNVLRLLTQQTMVALTLRKNGAKAPTTTSNLQNLRCRRQLIEESIYLSSIRRIRHGPEYTELETLYLCRRCHRFTGFLTAIAHEKHRERPYQERTVCADINNVRL